MVNFLSWLNSTCYDGLPYAIVTISFVLTFKYIRFPDVTCAGAFVSGGAAAAYSTVNLGAAPLVAIFLACLAGALGGALTAFFHIALRIDRLLAGILSAFALYSINLMILRPTLAYGDSPTLLSTVAELDREVNLGGIAWHPYAIGLLLGIVLVIKLSLDWIFDSEFGLALRALEDEGAGAATLRRVGIGPARFQLFALTLGNALVALSGALISAKEGAANVSRGFDVLVTGLIAFLLGVQLAEWLPNLAERLMERRALRQLRFIVQLRRLRITTLAAIGAVLYFGIVAMSYRVDVPSEWTKLLLAFFVALTVGDYAWLRTQFSALRQRQIHPVLSVEPKAGPPPVRPLTAVANLTYTYPGYSRPALRNVSLTLSGGELVRLAGENGSGKTTLLRLIAGHIEYANAGRIVIDGVDLTYYPSTRRKHCAYLAQDASLSVVSTLTVRENLVLSDLGARASLTRRCFTRRRNQRLAALLEEFNLPASLSANPSWTLSGGQRQAVNFLMLAANNPTPRVVLLDEPFNNLDAGNTKHCLAMISALREKGTTLIIVDHLMRARLRVDREILLDTPLEELESARGFG